MNRPTTLPPPSHFRRVFLVRAIYREGEAEYEEIFMRTVSTDRKDSDVDLLIPKDMGHDPDDFDEYLGGWCCGSGLDHRIVTFGFVEIDDPSHIEVLSQYI